jgi:hypothetical protein
MSSTRWTDADLMAHQARMGRKDFSVVSEPAAATKPSKYRNVKVVVDGERFDSKREAQHWAELKLRERIGDISGLRRQVPYDLRCPTDTGDGQLVVAQYIADAVFVDKDGLTHVQDVKGGRATQTALFKLKQKWLALQSNIEIEIV